MGLDITAYSRLQLVRHDVYGRMAVDDDYDPWDAGFIQGFAYAPFVASTRGLQGHDQPCPDGSDWIGTGWYERTIDTEEHNFRAGSYGGYGYWRNDLAAFAVAQLSGVEIGDPDKLRVPFIELTYFADNEGCIGPEAAKDLYEDFVRYETAYKSCHADNFKETYDDFMLACKIAADGGLIQFH